MGLGNTRDNKPLLLLLNQNTNLYETQRKWVKVSDTLSPWSFVASSTWHLFWNAPDMQVDSEKTKLRCSGAQPAVFGSALSHGSEQVLQWQSSKAVGLSDLAQTMGPLAWHRLGEQPWGSVTVHGMGSTLSSGHKGILTHSESCWAPVSEKPHGKTEQQQQKIWRCHVSPLLFNFFFCLLVFGGFFCNFCLK